MKKIRKQKLIKTSLQLRLTLVFLTLAFIAALFQVILLNRSILSMSAQMPADGDILMTQLPRVLGQNLLITVVVLVPVMIGVGILVTHRVAGPVYRFEKYLSEIARGEDVGPCVLRDGDELQELCDRLNEAVVALKEQGTAQPERKTARKVAEAA
jgi:signal peptidase II